MKQNKIIMSMLIASCLLALGFTLKPTNFSQHLSLTQPGDTTAFAPNKSGGWDIFSSYLNQDTPDTVEFDLCLKQKSLIVWSTEQPIGTITNKAFIPKKNQQVHYDLFANNTWSVRVT